MSKSKKNAKPTGTRRKKKLSVEMPLPTNFQLLQKSYGLVTPEQVKLRIIWNHIQALILNTAGSSHENQNTLRRYDSMFKTCEAEERRLSEIKV